MYWTLLLYLSSWLSEYQYANFFFLRKIREKLRSLNETYPGLDWSLWNTNPQAHAGLNSCLSEDEKMAVLLEYSAIKVRITQTPEGSSPSGSGQPTSQPGYPTSQPGYPTSQPGYPRYPSPPTGYQPQGDGYPSATAPTYVSGTTTTSFHPTTQSMTDTSSTPLLGEFRFCSSCGTKATRSARFCASCGAAML